MGLPSTIFTRAFNHNWGPIPTFDEKASLANIAHDLFALFRFYQPKFGLSSIMNDFNLPNSNLRSISYSVIGRDQKFFLNQLSLVILRVNF